MSQPFRIDAIIFYLLAEKQALHRGFSSYFIFFAAIYQRIVCFLIILDQL